VALFVFGMFFVHVGLVTTGLVTKFSLPYLLLIAPLVYVQFKTIRVMLKLDRKLLRQGSPETPSVGKGTATA